MHRFDEVPDDAFFIQDASWKLDMMMESDMDTHFYDFQRWEADKVIRTVLDNHNIMPFPGGPRPYPYPPYTTTEELEVRSIRDAEPSGVWHV